jgi:hypothetical protein
MGCGCNKKIINKSITDIKYMAVNESKLEKTDYIIYEIDGKKYYDRLTCWEKAGRLGRVIELIYYN